jgi:hypothetical protein
VSTSRIPGPALYLGAEDLYPGLPERKQGLKDGAGLVGYVVGEEDGGFELLRRLLIHCTQPEHTAHHQWQTGDLMICKTTLAQPMLFTSHGCVMKCSV